MQVLFERAPNYRDTIRAGKDARHLWFALREWRGDDPEDYFGALGVWAEKRIKEHKLQAELDRVIRFVKNLDETNKVRIYNLPSPRFHFLDSIPSSSRSFQCQKIVLIPKPISGRNVSEYPRGAQGMQGSTPTSSISGVFELSNTS